MQTNELMAIACWILVEGPRAKKPGKHVEKRLLALTKQYPPHLRALHLRRAKAKLSQIITKLLEKGKQMSKVESQAELDKLDV